MNVETTPEIIDFGAAQNSAALEFHAAMQLLAERARSLTRAEGVAVALAQDGRFVYGAACGSMVPEIGATADVKDLPLQSSTPSASQLLRIAISKDEKIVGFFELAPGKHAFAGVEVEAVSRLAALAATAIEHREAAEHCLRLIREANPVPPTTPGPLRWHAPELSASEPIQPDNSPAQTPADVHACSSCGFPVSGVRTLCVDCEAHPKSKLNSDAPAGPDRPAELFAVARQESWISKHGYTIASILVTALAAAIIYWLR